ncbi:MAG: ATP-grasp domain-containing protein [Candidatus Pacebacteria bacterium]|nr:ATP-grasp domain-containing protein [Candidatus Paceibacterota bacterium]
MEKQQKNIIAYVMSMPADVPESIAAYNKAEKTKYRTMLIWDSRVKRNASKPCTSDIVVECDFSKPHKIAEALLPYQKELAVVTCRGDKFIGRFIEVIPHVPYLRTPTTESLRWATDKYEMRKRFKMFDTKNTPKFTKVTANTKKERKRVIEKIGFPMIVKPTNLAGSMLVTECYHEEDLERALRTGFRKIKKVYNENGRGEAPNLMVEAYMEGDMYSVDAYVNARGTIHFCPMVKVVTGKNIGHDDFYNYMHLTPTALKKETIERAHAVAKTGVHALGLRSTTVHVELMKIDDEWKIIEIGPRIGGFRHKLHKLSCDIDHSLNDVLVRLPKKPIVPKKCKGYAATLKWFPKKEGVITKLKGIKKIQELKSFSSITVNKKVGDRCHFAKHGGKAVFNVTLYNSDRAKLLADIRRIEQCVEVGIK